MSNENQQYRVMNLVGTPTDYSKQDNWAHLPENTDKAVDTFFVYPTVDNDPTPGAPTIVPIENEALRAAVENHYFQAPLLFEDLTNLYEPYYRQSNLFALFGKSPEELLAFQLREQRTDVYAALDYYFEHFNQGRPFILAGHSQGSLMLKIALQDYFREHADYLERMVAAYVLGFSITTDDLANNPDLKFAQGADDVGVIVSWNTEGPGNKNEKNGVVLPHSLAINPLNWRRDDTYAPASENLGDRLPIIGDIGITATEFHVHYPGLADARLERWKKVGYGAKCHMLVAQKSEYDHYARHGIALTDSITCLYRQGTGVGSNADSRHWRWLSSSPRDRVWNFEPDPGEILFWEPLRDPDCDGRRLTERYLRKVRDSAERLARTHPWITRWQFAGELFSTQLPKTWGVATREEAYTVFARIFKAWAEGMRAGNPSIKITHDCPWNLNPGHGLEEVDRLLKALNDEGVRVDWISAHTYRLRPEHPDLDANLTALRQVMARRGYGDAELCLPEGMHWGPYSIPAWGTTPSSWGPEPRTWHSGCLSYDMGWWEKISAAWRVRSWIIALKHGVSSSCSAGTLTFEMDSDRLTPFVTQVAPNTPGHVLGHATRFLGDFRPAPEIRIYAFDDGFDRPVAVVWCCDPCVDDGLAPPYELESDFAGTLETVIDFMNNPRAGRTRGAWRYPATSFPIYLRGLKGSSGEFLEALRTTRCVSGGVTNAASVRQDRMKVPRVKGTTPDWSAVPARALIPWGGGGTRGSAQLAWNDAGLFVRVSVCDDRLVHRVFPLGRQRNDNDTLQIGIDTCGDALQQATAGCNQDDYEYAIFPNESGPGAVTWANRVADCQMTGFFGQQGNCLIPEVPASFTRTSGGGVYEVFIPANRLLPGRLARGARMGLGLTVTDADDDALPYGRRVIGGASLGPAVASRVGRPRTWTEIEFE